MDTSPFESNDLTASRLMKKPNFFLLGAGRCGSTTLYQILGQHPEIFMSEVKEPSFFCSYFQVVRDPVSYFKLFDRCENERAIGEASHVYFSNPETSSILHLLFPDARFILILRNPTNRAYSLFQWMRSNGYEDLKTFEAAIKAESQRYEDPVFFKECPQYFWNFMYLRSSYYHNQWNRYLRFYPRHRFFVMSLHELSTDPVYWIRRVYKFLGVKSTFTPSIEHLNAVEYPPLDASIRERLDRHFEKVISATEAIAGRDLKLTRM